MEIAIIGVENVGGALGKRWARAGRKIAYSVPHPANMKYRVTAAPSSNNATFKPAAGGVPVLANEGQANVSFTFHVARPLRIQNDYLLEYLRERSARLT